MSAQHENPKPEDPAQECLQDVVSHYGDFRKALTLARDACPGYDIGMLRTVLGSGAQPGRNVDPEDGDADYSYWQHQINVLDRMKRQAEQALGEPNGLSPEDTERCWRAVVQFALENEDGKDFLRCWNEGRFDVIREEWPEAPEAVFLADPGQADAATSPARPKS